MEAWDSEHFVFEVVELVKFFFEVFKLWLGGIELFELLFLVSLPEPVESAEAS